MSLREDYRYDPDQHYAPPIRITWVTRSKKLSMERWVFVQCCGQTRKVAGHIINSMTPCKSTRIPTTQRHHPGSLILLRTSHSNVVKNTPDLARWSCCGSFIPPWDDSWDSRDGKIPFSFVDNGCKPGRYDQDGDGSPGSDSDEDLISRYTEYSFYILKLTCYNPILLKIFLRDRILMIRVKTRSYHEQVHFGPADLHIFENLSNLAINC